MPRLTIAVPLTALTLALSERRTGPRWRLREQLASSRRRRSPRPPDAVAAEVVADDDLDDAARHATAPSPHRRGGRGRLRSGPGHVTGVRHDGRHAGDPAF